MSERVNECMSEKAFVAGVGMVKFAKPGASENYDEMTEKAVRLALEDAGVGYGDVQQAYASYIYGDSTCGQKGLYRVGETGIPIINVNNNCSSGSTALFLARQAVAGGMVDCALVVGFEQMQPGALGSNWNDRPSPFEDFGARMDRLGYPITKAGPAPCVFGAGGMEYLKRYDADPAIFGKVAVKTRSHAGRNPFALFTAPMTLEEVMTSPVIYEPHLTRYMACPPTCGAAAAIVCSAAFAKKHGIGQLVEIAGQGLATDASDSWDSAINLVGAQMTRRAAATAYEQAGLGPEDVQVVELHDCFTPNEVISYEGLGLCGEGEASKLIADGDNTYGGRYVVNPSGGLMSKGHPIGATGVAQCAELCWHLRGQAGERQVEGARVALQHNIGLGGAAVVTLYRV
ncbi:lipid-transfer protein [Spongiibacter taiwanensis]|uniref:lipid-transfer protein n=1 Tax=Spongiibacter taiwanensis TaxID=1748242 RepID=UPI002035D54D|nr:lipid-transfer protein [Spongiibacter taiwanensis]USA42583.1 lipid-transfer protein [Spongiibacter taiwanensis]